MNNLLLFAKTPILGKVKTRLLSPSLNELEVLDLYIAFLKDTLKSVVLSNAKTIYFACYPASSMEEMKEFLRNSGFQGEMDSERIVIIPQYGSSFEKRLSEAANKVLSFSTLLVIIGSDTPTLRPALINNAFDMLRFNRDAMVLGPSGEGGVYLIGTGKKNGLDFTDIFDSGNEIENLADYTSAHGLHLCLLEELTDIDVQADLLTVKGYLYALNCQASKEGGLYFPHHTFEAMRQTGLSIKRDNGNTRNKQLVRE